MMWGKKRKQKKALINENESWLQEELIATFNGRHKVPLRIKFLKFLQVMEHLGKRIFSFLKTRKEEAAPLSFMANGSALLEELIVSFNGKHKIPIRHFTGEELIKAIDDFRDCAVVTKTATIFGGSFKQRRILIKESRNVYGLTMTLTDVIHDIVITSQMSHHKNVLKLVGCCLDRRIPAVVYEYVGTELLPHLLYNRKGSTGLDRSFLSWKRRLKTAKDIANVILYLHTAFPTPIIYREIIMENVFIDQLGSAKLFNFSLCIALPPGESQMEDIVRGKMGYTAPDYIMTGIVSEKLDVYSFGIFLLQLLTGDEPFGMAGNVKTPHLVDRVKTFVDKGQFYEIPDHNLLGEEGGIEKEDHFQTCLALALSCSQEKGEDRPEMIDVAKELKRIESESGCGSK